ncbi:manganese efflux pump MntP [Dubosiella newyorkensis]|uniref:Putative manganese efflux pump MntP n=1 Tax=Dubosiella newyorkensis TaxID=1862672 RepID=A0A1U7NM14_9FIRM|nr:manganese efflux pump MntP family protein [Dubosiella newyorkensis]OLU46083.1 hypothetical protein BO225_07315 [Dubosiella newyorkensis]
MSWIELFLIALSLSMDAFAVSIAKGLSLKKVTWKQMTWFGAWFGIFQGLMPFLGYCFAQLASGWLEQFDHWIAFILLSMIGGKMIWDSFHEEESIDPEIGWKSMLVLAIATSIDALAVGVSFAFMSVSIFPAITMIGAVTFAFSAIGTKIGSLFGAKYHSKATLCGSIVLVLIGLKILIEGIV